MLPNLIIIGGMKCGTTSLHTYLGRVPGIFMSDHKELDFFKTHEDFSKGQASYEANFKDGFAFCGEASPNYSKRDTFPGVPARMASVVPDAKLIYVVRHPILRAFSHYLHNLAQGLERRPAKEVFDDLEDNFYLKTSKYHYQLEAFLKHYKPEQILVIDAWSLRSDRLQTIRKIMKFIGHNVEITEEMVEGESHKTGNKVQYGAVGRHIRKFKPRQELVNKIPFRSFLKKFITKPMPKEELTEVQRLKIIEYFRPDVEKLAAFSGDTYSDWLK